MKCEMDLRSRELLRQCRILKPQVLTVCILTLTIAFLIFMPLLKDVYLGYLGNNNAKTSLEIEKMGQQAEALEELAEKTTLLKEKCDLIRRYENKTKSIHALLSLILDQTDSNNLMIKDITITECSNLIISAYASSVVDTARFNHSLAQYPAVISPEVASLELEEEKYYFTIKSTFATDPENGPLNDATAGGFTDE